MATAKGRARQFHDPDEEIAKDHDPESNGPGSDSDNHDSDAEALSTEHYVRVGAAKLRKKENVSLGPEYRGSRVSRAAFENGDDDDEEDEFDDPDEVDLDADYAQASDSEIDSEDAFGASDDENFKRFTFRGSAKPAKLQRTTALDLQSDDGTDDSQNDVDDGLEALIDSTANDSGEEVADSSEGEGNEESEEEEEEEDTDSEKDKDETDENEGSGHEARHSQPDVSALSNRADVEKGVAIQKQRQIYDGLLNLRIRLQKALVAVNSFSTVTSAEIAWEAEPYEAAEEAAIKLLGTISSLRDKFASSPSTGDKRKREPSASMTSQDIWEQLQREDQAAVSFREERLEKWSSKVRSVTITRPNGLGRDNKTLVSVLREQLMDPDNRLVKRTRIARSCAPVQRDNKAVEDKHIYDDADFYQLLLKELVDQRTVEGVADDEAPMPSVMVTASKEAKIRKQVDRKASKGRKMRFTVHEKLQNFMAPEDRRRWEQGAIDRLFGTLFGRKLQLDEDESNDETIDVEEEGLKLFRN